ncbi:hypothetical protein yc1106_02758 [Curvularia clavata]|uniref:Uncharacterized protein n=1 Tax=Curvularia clavata TaxID=95742 RepID=A0A9Q8Z5Y8_CURCL|nr:hypothetical protein yc1106_02758 [Curvularia clavata]
MDVELFDYLRGEEDVGEIMARLKRHIKEGKELAWFQDVIPGLIPGVEGSEPWLSLARKLLWTDAQYTEHDEKIDRMERLEQPDPNPLIVDRYNLREHWMVCVEALRPMPIRMLEAANEIYRVVAGQECLTESQNRARLTSETDDKHFAFVTIAVTVQDKVVSPIIGDIEQRQKGLGERIERAQHQIRGLVQRVEYIVIEDSDDDMHEDDDTHKDDNTHEEDQDACDKEALQQYLDRLNAEKQEDQALLDALKKFRDILVDEKEIQDQDHRKDLKRSGVEQRDEAS